jgi:hypothetical protein
MDPDYVPILVKGLSFSEALDRIKAGQELSREGWNGPNQKVFLVEAEKTGPVTVPFLCIETTDGKTVPWLASQTDLLANDWFLQE